MKVIEYETEQELDTIDAEKLAVYQNTVTNSTVYTRFAHKFEKDGKWYMVYNPSLSDYFTPLELLGIMEITL